MIEKRHLDDGTFILSSDNLFKRTALQRIGGGEGAAETCIKSNGRTHTHTRPITGDYGGVEMHHRASVVVVAVAECVNERHVILLPIGRKDWTEPRQQTLTAAYPGLFLGGGASVNSDKQKTQKVVPCWSEIWGVGSVGGV